MTPTYDWFDAWTQEVRRDTERLRDRAFGIPNRLDRMAVYADGSRHSEARRGRTA